MIGEGTVKVDNGEGKRNGSLHIAEESKAVQSWNTTPSLSPNGGQLTSTRSALLCLPPVFPLKKSVIGQ